MPSAFTTENPVKRFDPPPSLDLRFDRGALRDSNPRRPLPGQQCPAKWRASPHFVLRLDLLKCGFFFFHPTHFCPLLRIILRGVFLEQT